MTVKRVKEKDTEKWAVKNVHLELNHEVHPSDWMLKFMRCYKNMMEQEKALINTLQKAKLEPRRVMQVFTVMGRDRRGIMFDTIKISNIDYKESKELRNTNIEQTMKLFKRLKCERDGFHHVEETN